MLKYFDCAETMAEFPDEISLCLNISNCPCKCKGCSEPWLWEDVGTELTNEEIDNLIKKHPYVSCIGLLGGDSDHQDIVRIAKYITGNYGLKVGFYSGFDYLDYDLIPYLNFYKIGRWIDPNSGLKNCGGLVYPNSNQLYFEIKNGMVINKTYRFRETPISNLERTIIK